MCSLTFLAPYTNNDHPQTFTRTAESPFNSEAKSMSISGTHATGGTLNGASRDTYYTKGALDALLDRCKFYHVADGSTPPLDAGTRASIISRAQTTATYGLFDGPDASTSRPATPAGREQDNLVFVGFQAMRDPPRRGVADSISLLQNGGVQVVMITGDAAPTALAIARDLGLRVGRAPQGLNELGVPLGHSRNASVASYCLTGAQIDKMSKAQLREAVGGVSVFARTTPRHKMAIVEAFQARGAVVGMTGDGGTFLLFRPLLLRFI
jgi:P-type Ca2+ transporter type 2C